MVITCPGLLQDSVRNTHSVQNTPEGFVKTHDIQTHQKVMKECFTLVCHFLSAQCKKHIRLSKHTREWCKNVLHWSAVSSLGIAKNTNNIQNTPEGDVRMYYIVLQCLLTGNARNTLGIQNTPEGVVIMFFTGLQFLYRAL
jgi:hypothetical protein